MQEKIQRLCRYIEKHCEQSLTLDDLSQQAKLSPFYLQRRFREIVGISPRQYQEACRLNLLKVELRNTDSAPAAKVTRAIFEAGFGSSSRVYARADSQLGMTPRQYQKSGKGLEISYALAQTPLGLLMLAATDRGLCFVQFGDNEDVLLRTLNEEYADATLHKMARRSIVFSAWITALNHYLSGATVTPELPLDIRGTAFQIKVWRYLQRIPHGQQKTYTEVAHGIGQPKAVRAVANACAANQLALLIPCHRVIRGDGGLGGFRWGVERKQQLLKLEKMNTARDHVSPQEKLHRA